MNRPLRHASVPLQALAQCGELVSVRTPLRPSPSGAPIGFNAIAAAYGARNVRLKYERSLKPTSNAMEPMLRSAKRGSVSMRCARTSRWPAGIARMSSRRSRTASGHNTSPPAVLRCHGDAAYILLRPPAGGAKSQATRPSVAPCRRSATHNVLTIVPASKVVQRYHRF
jgi:hypothetical protein